MRKELSRTKGIWPSLSLYERFEQVIALVLTFLVSVVIVVATWNLVKHIWGLAVDGLVEPSRPEVFQTIFGMVMIVLIALEFNHSLLGVVERGRSIVQVRTVVLIALLAVLRKFIIIEVGHAEASLLIGLAIAAVSLGAVLWALRGQDLENEDRSVGSWRDGGRREAA
jgi:uncharacterized membrane protein (DUF373 family)